MMVLEMLPVLQGILERGFIFSLPVIAIYLSSRIIRFDDLTTEGSFGIGSAVTAFCILHAIPWWVAVAVAMIAGGVCGLITGLLHTALGINKLISGIITTTGLFSITLALAGSFVSLPRDSLLFGVLSEHVGAAGGLIFLISIASLTTVAVGWLLRTKLGLMLRALGDNPQLLTVLGKSRRLYTVACLFLANALTALSGALFVQYTGYFSLWTQVGVLILTLAGLMLSEMIASSFGLLMLSGPLLYQALVAATFELELDPTWNKLLTAVLMVGLFVLQRFFGLRVKHD